MRDTNSSRRTIVTILLGLLAAFSVMACNGGPTEPTFDELVGGRWRGSINGFQVVLDVRTAPAPGTGGGFNLSGSANALNPTTGESHPLTISGSSWVRNAECSLITVGGATTGQFWGEVAPDGRSWPGRFTSNTALGAAPIFGPGEYAVTLSKD